MMMMIKIIDKREMGGGSRQRDRQKQRSRMRETEREIVAELERVKARAIFNKENRRDKQRR